MIVCQRFGVLFEFYFLITNLKKKIMKFFMKDNLLLKGIPKKKFQLFTLVYYLE